MKILLVWELVPEDTKFYLLDVSEEEAKKIEACHGWLINSVNWNNNLENLNWLSEYLVGKDPLERVEGEGFRLGQVDLIVQSGFFL